MRITQIMPGAVDAFYCENCLRDSWLYSALSRLGHQVTAVPLYLPLSLENLEVRKLPVFFGGVNVYLQQRFGLFRRSPRWLDRLFDSPRLLGWVSKRSGMVDASALGELTVSMLRGADGRQAKELARLVDWLASQPRPDVVCLSNALLLGLAGPIRSALGVPIVCLLQDEDEFLDALEEPHRSQAWETLKELARDVALFVPASRYYADFMASRLSLPEGKLRVVHNGIAASGSTGVSPVGGAPVIGFLSRLCRHKGLGTLVEAFMRLKANPRWKELRLRAAGGWTWADLPFLQELRQRLRSAGLEGQVEFLPHLDSDGRRALLESLTLLSVPAQRAASGLFILESLQAGVPVVAPAHGSYVELLEATGGGVLVEPDNPAALAEALERLLSDPAAARALGQAGQVAVAEKFSIDDMAAEMAAAYESVRVPRLRRL